MTSAALPQQRPGPPLPHVLQLRLSEDQRRYLLFLAATSERAMSQVVRDTIDQALDAETVATDDDDSLPDELRGRTPLRALLGHLDLSEAESIAARYGPPVG